MDDRANAGDGRGAERRGNWLAQGVEVLYASQAGDGAALEFDVLIVGSGYGGAVAAAQLAGALKPDGRPARVAMLERGSEYLPGAFPARMADLPAHVRVSAAGHRMPMGRPTGLFDIRVGSDLNVLLANGVGGGSLINGGVLVRPGPPAAARLAACVPHLERYYRLAERALGAVHQEQPNTIWLQGAPPPPKFLALEKLAQGMGASFAAAPLSIAMVDGNNAAGIGLEACNRCGDCATGCNFNAKDSLDTNLLVRARRQGLLLYSGATVTKLEREACAATGQWLVYVAHTHPGLRSRENRPLVLRARTVILAAGALGSTEILLRSRSAQLAFSPRLGQQFSSNGTMVAAVYGQAEPANAYADEDSAACARNVGPTITGMATVPDSAGHGTVIVEDMAVPAPLGRLFEELFTTAATLEGLAQGDPGQHGAAQDGERDPCAVNPDAMARTSLIAMLGNDGAQGALELAPDQDGADGAIRVRWPGLRDHRLFAHQVGLLRGAAGTEARVLPNPLWQPVPDAMQALLAGRRGATLSVHPLGGCPVGAAGDTGVVDHRGRVFRGDSDEPYPGLLVLDGAVIPVPIGINPALTIAAICWRAARHLRRALHWTAPAAGIGFTERPRFQLPPNVRAVHSRPTEVAFAERMGGQGEFRRRDGSYQRCYAELTLRFEKCGLGALARDPAPMRRTLKVDGTTSKFELFDLDAWSLWQRQREVAGAQPPAPLLSMGISGRLEFLQRGERSYKRRCWHGLWAWLLNRGLRDGWQLLLRSIAEKGGWATLTHWRWSSLRERGRVLLALASHAGEVRRFDYVLGFEPPPDDGSHPFVIAPSDSQAIRGSKRLTYARAENLWCQLQHMSLDACPLLRPGSAARLALDTGFLVRNNVPLLRITDQQDQPRALADGASALAYLLRLLLTVHLWSFRAPDEAPSATPQRLPGKLPGWWRPAPEVRELEVDRLPDGTPVHARLTRYRPRPQGDKSLPSVLLIHGYSANGTTFTHHALRPALADVLWRRGRDVWVLDLRTSSGMPTAHLPWSLEQVALADIPAAVAHVCAVTGDSGIDVFAHCVGAAMFSMALLAPPRSGERFVAERLALPGAVRRLVLSQFSPYIVFSRENVLRGYLMGYLRMILPLKNYRYRIEREPTLMDDLLDRLLATLPYPEQEFRLENPIFRPAAWVRTRHRMDALLGRVFNLSNVKREVLAHIDDFFGPMNVETLAQISHFARLKRITNRAGRNVYVSRATLGAHWTCPTLSLHGGASGVTDAASASLLFSQLAPLWYQLETRVLEDCGHQDGLMGRQAPEFCTMVADFLDAEHLRLPAPPEHEPKTPRWTGAVPAYGPVRTNLSGDPEWAIGAGLDPGWRDPALVAMLPVREQDGYFVPADAGAGALATMRLYAGIDDGNGWLQLVTTRPAGEGLLLLLLYDQGHYSDDRNYRPAYLDPRLRNVELQAYATRMAAGSTDLQQAVAAFLQEQRPAIVDEIMRILASMPAARLLDGYMPVQGEVDSIVVGSCQYPAGLLDQLPGYASFRRLSHLLAEGGETRPGLLLLLGDQIYSDATAGLFDPTALDDRYLRPYEKLLAQPAVRSVLRQLPVLAMLDDHEIRDDWEPDPGAAGADQDLLAGRAAHGAYLRVAAATPPLGPILACGLEYCVQTPRWSLFMADTRSERDGRSSRTASVATIMSERQMVSLEQWLLREPPERIKLVATPSMLLPRHVASMGGQMPLHSDSWDGYPASLYRVLAFLADHCIANTVFLSGDEHLSCDVRFTVTRLDADNAAPARATARSIHSSAMYAPYPFANARQADLQEQETFTFASPKGGTYQCEVSAVYYPGDGFALLQITQPCGGTPQLSCRFNRAQGELHAHFNGAGLSVP